MWNSTVKILLANYLKINNQFNIWLNFVIFDKTWAVLYCSTQVPIRTSRNACQIWVESDWNLIPVGSKSKYFQVDSEQIPSRFQVQFHICRSYLVPGCMWLCYRQKCGACLLDPETVCLSLLRKMQIFVEGSKKQIWLMGIFSQKGNCIQFDRGLFLNSTSV